MVLKSVTLSGFRSFTQTQTFSFDPKFTLIIGPNSVGKTNLLEAIYCLSRAHGFREKKLGELINYHQPMATLQAALNDEHRTETLTLKFTQTQNETDKKFFVNGFSKPFRSYQQRTLSVVLFKPDDLLTVSGNPEKRRSYFDHVLASTDLDYYQAKHNFEKALYKRNKMLEHQSQHPQPEWRQALAFWDDYLNKQIARLTQARQRLTDFYNSHPHLNGLSFGIVYRPNRFIASNNQAQLAKELAMRRTLTGPQLDDFVFFRQEGQDQKNLSVFGSRSEQRLTVLWLKINELKYLEYQNSHAPILLMDDIFSELDEQNMARILKVSHAYQTIVTTAHRDVLPLIKFKIKKLTLSP